MTDARILRSLAGRFSVEILTTAEVEGYEIALLPVTDGMDTSAVCLSTLALSVSGVLELDSVLLITGL